jgi:hypothetical protein
MMKLAHPTGLIELSFLAACEDFFSLQQRLRVQERINPEGTEMLRVLCLKG